MADNRPFPEPHPEALVKDWLALVGTKVPVNGPYIGGWPPIEAGQTWLAPDGQRFVCFASSFDITFYVNGKFFHQNPAGFIDEVLTYPYYAAGKASAWLATVAEFEMKVIMGIIAGASGAGFFAIVGTEVAEFYKQNRKNFGKWSRMLTAVMEVRATLKRIAPTLYDKVFNAVLLRLLGKIPEGVPEAVAFAVGVILGHAGKALWKGKFNEFSVLMEVLKQLVLRFVTSVAPVAAKLALADLQKFEADFIQTMKDEGVSISSADVKQIGEEVQKHPREMKEAFDKLKTAFSEDGEK
jgi:hypothetical protein